MAALTAIAVAGLALTAVGVGTQFIAQQKQAKAAKKSAKEQAKITQAENIRARRRTIREARIKRGQALNVGAQIGAGEGSGLAGGLSGIGSQLGANIGFLGGTERIQSKISSLSQKQASAAQLGAIGGGIAGIGGSLFGAAGGINAFKESGGG
jgi:hypothetical protein